MELDEFLGARADWSKTSGLWKSDIFGKLRTSGFGCIPMVLSVVVQVGIVSCRI